MSAQVHIVTDSTAGLSAAEVDRYGITVVPLQVIIGGISYDEGAATSESVTEALRSWTPVSTSRPAPQAFTDAYTACAEAGATEIVSIHLSAEMSGTFESAMIGAKESPVPVRHLDAKTLGMGLGFPVITAAETAQRGADGAEVEAAAQARIQAVSSFFYVDTLEYLRRGGRIGAAQALLGAALAVKPLLTITDGRIVPLEKVRTSARAIARLGDIAAERAGKGPVDIAVHHLGNLAAAEGLANTLSERLPEAGDILVRDVGAVIGAHVGPGVLAVVVAPRRS